MTGGDQVHPDLGRLPDGLVGKAVKDRDFRAAVLSKRGNRDGLKQYLASKGFNNLSDDALTFIADLDPDTVKGVLRGIDAPLDPSLDVGDDPSIMAS